MSYFGGVGQYLTDKDLGNLSSSSKSLQWNIKKQFDARKSNLRESESLSKVPRESRFEAHQKILESGSPRADVLRNLIDAHWHLPREHRAVALAGILEMAAKLPDQKREAILTKASGLDPRPDYVVVPDAMHDLLAIISNAYSSEVKVALLREVIINFIAVDSPQSMPSEYKVDAFDAIIDKTNSTEVLRPLAIHLDKIPEADRIKRHDAILGKTNVPEVLANLSRAIRYLPEAVRTEKFDAFLNTNNNSRVLSGLVGSIRHLPREEDRGERFNTIVKNTSDPAVLASLVHIIDILPKEDRAAMVDGIMIKTLDNFPEAERTERFDRILHLVRSGINSEPEVFKSLAVHLHKLPEAVRTEKFNAIVKNAYDSDVLKFLKDHVGCVPEADRNNCLGPVNYRLSRN